MSDNPNIALATIEAFGEIQNIPPPRLAAILAAAAKNMERVVLRGREFPPAPIP